MDYGNLLTSVNAAYYVVLAVMSVLYVVITWRIYAKAGEPGWAAIVPFYGSYVLYKICWGNGWLFLLLLIPFVNAVVGIITLYKLSKVFGHGVPFTLGLVFFHFIFFCILGFGPNERYVGLSK